MFFVKLNRFSNTEASEFLKLMKCCRLSSGIGSITLASTILSNAEIKSPDTF